MSKVINESTTTVDIAGVELKLAKLIYRIYTESLLNRIGARINVAVPNGSIFAFKGKYLTDYTGTDKSSTPYATVLPDFAGNRANNQETDVKAEMNYEIVKRAINCQTKKIRSKWSIEAITDLVALTGKTTVEDILEKELLTEIIQEIDFSALKMMTTKATKTQLTLKAPNDPLVGIELFNAAQKKILEMAASTKRAITMCITAPYETCAKLMSHPNFKANEDFTNSYFMGSIGATEIYCDYYNSLNKEYMLISYKHRNKEVEIADGSTCFAFYSYNITKAFDATSGAESYFHFLRYDVVQHPLDNTNDGQSIFLHCIEIQ
ncbi:putative major capsid protein [Campylobacter phage F352]|uniref:Putative major capsid protein n=3 Tax=Fletchervirus CPX TaxID=1110702 RepID=A0A7T3KHR0_9CAUD|nr:putative major capsid protein [Campylobacter phage F352]QPX65486.1 putative major capsid protein [Campylobacter phage F374]QPX65653.1 putative major capsid protein [Campylobacter phage F375]QXO06088.1 hypothetical protein [Campylobacter phage CJLB-10]